jgi:hypothetical protein
MAVFLSLGETGDKEYCTSWCHVSYVGGCNIRGFLRDRYCGIIKGKAIARGSFLAPNRGAGQQESQDEETINVGETSSTRMNQRFQRMPLLKYRILPQLRVQLLRRGRKEFGCDVIRKNPHQPPMFHVILGDCGACSVNGRCVFVSRLLTVRHCNRRPFRVSPTHTTRSIPLIGF